MVLELVLDNDGDVSEAPSDRSLHKRGVDHSDRMRRCCASGSLWSSLDHVGGSPDGVVLQVAQENDGKR